MSVRAYLLTSVKGKKKQSSSEKEPSHRPQVPGKEKASWVKDLKKKKGRIKG